MTVKELCDALGLTVFHMEEPDRAVTGGYCGDLLSWVMGRCPEDAAWITIMSNQNVAAVAVLCDPACTILCEGVAPDPELVEKAQSQGVNLLGAAASEYELAWRLKALLA